MTEPATAAETQVRPNTYDPQAHGPWTYTCRSCRVVTQGGRPGLDAHVATCHPEEAVSS